MSTTIVQKDTPVLREIACPIEPAEFGSTELASILKNMKTALEAQADGAAIAAPQIGISKRIFIISDRVFGPNNKEFGSNDPHLIFINPRIIKLSRKKKVLDEGCLSVRGYYGTVKRAVGATIEACDEHGQKFTRGAGGLLAQVFQHECDHLDGTLFIDRAEEVWEIDHESKE